MSDDPGERVALAAFVGSLLVFLASWPWPERIPGLCEAPREIESRGGHTVRVACGPESAERREVRGPARRLFGLPLDPNRADAETLAQLPGIGPARAAAILAEREHGPFEGPRDLERVSGIGRRTAERIAPWLHFPPKPAARRGSSKTGSLPKSGGAP